MRHPIRSPLHSELNPRGYASFLALSRLNKLGILAMKFTRHMARCEKKFYSKEIYFFLHHSFCLKPNVWQVEETQTYEASCRVWVHPFLSSQSTSIFLFNKVRGTWWLCLHSLGEKTPRHSLWWISGNDRHVVFLGPNHWCTVYRLLLGTRPESPNMCVSTHDIIPLHMFTSSFVLVQGVRWVGRA